MSGDFSIELKGTSAVKSLLDPKHIRRATQNAINTVATGYRKDSVNKAAEVFKIKKGRLKKDSSGPTTSIKRASRQELAAYITYRSRRPGLQHFATRKTNPAKGHPKYTIKRNEGKKELERGFFSTMPKGGHGLFQRKGEKRYPITRREGPSIKQMYEDSLVGAPLEKKYPEEIESVFDKKLRDQLAKVKK